jgi:nitric oxide dioxygenase
MYICFRRPTMNPNYLNPSQIALIKATVPALLQHGETITSHFYASLFEAHPELLNVFNPVNQRNGKQARSLSDSVLAYAANIDHPERLSAMLGHITHKHVSLQVDPAHYPIVGSHLLQAIATVLGDAATPEILEVWGIAYGQLADLMMGIEGQMYQQNLARGWNGFKPFVVRQKVQESSNITSFILVPSDGKTLPEFQAGQYISVQIPLEGGKQSQIRQYSLSDAHNSHFYRISVKREDSPDSLEGEDVPDGLISNHLHGQLEVGDTLQVHMPAGQFVLQHSQRPVVLLSGGVGITPLISMLKTLLNSETPRDIVFIHASRGSEFHPFREKLNTLVRHHANLRKVVFYTTTTPNDQKGEHHDEIGYIHLEALKPYLPKGDAEYYYCGPFGFVCALEDVLDELQIPMDRRFTETFGPSQSLLRNIPVLA